MKDDCGIMSTTIVCAYCDEGYYDNGGNIVKCDHCHGVGYCLCRECKDEV